MKVLIFTAGAVFLTVVDSCSGHVVQQVSPDLCDSTPVCYIVEDGVLTRVK